MKMGLNQPRWEREDSQLLAAPVECIVEMSKVFRPLITTIPKKHSDYW